MLLKQKNGIYFIQFPELLSVKNVWHAIFLRMGGVSPDPFATLNISDGNGDAIRHIEANRRRIRSILPAGKLFAARQTHGIKVLDISKELDLNKQVLLSGDAMISPQKAQFLMIQVADCQAIFLVDPVCKVVANIHSGWRGSVANIIGNTISAMLDKYGCKPEDILAAIGPSLGPCCAEFINYEKEIPRKFWPYKDSRNRFDFWTISRDQLKKAGVKESSIYMSRICTRCNPHLFFSYRYKKRTGRFAAVIGRT